MPAAARANDALSSKLCQRKGCGLLVHWMAVRLCEWPERVLIEWPALVKPEAIRLQSASAALDAAVDALAAAARLARPKRALRARGGGHGDVILLPIPEGASDSMRARIDEINAERLAVAMRAREERRREAEREREAAVAAAAREREAAERQAAVEAEREEARRCDATRVIAGFLLGIRARDRMSDLVIDAQRAREAARARIEAGLREAAGAADRALEATIARLSADTAVAALRAVLMRAATWRTKPTRSAAATLRRRGKAKERKRARANSDGRGGSAQQVVEAAVGSAPSTPRERVLNALLLTTQRALKDRTAMLALTRKQLRRETKTAKARWQQLARRGSKAAKKLSRKLFAKQARGVAGAARREGKRASKRKQPEGEPLHSSARKHQRLVERSRGGRGGGREGSRGRGGGPSARGRASMHA